MHQNKRRVMGLAIMAVLVLATILGMNGLLLGKTSRASSAQPPVEKLHAYSLSNAPTAVTSSWSTNMPSDPAKVQVMQQIATRVRAGQPAYVATSAPTTAGGFRDQTQAEAMRQLRQRVGSSLQIYLRPENSTPIQLKGSPLAQAVATTGSEAERNEATAEAFLRENGPLLLVSNPDQELALANRQSDPLGGELLRFTQQYQGVPVWPAEIGVHLDAAGDIMMMDGAYVATPADVSVSPALTEAQAKAKALDAVNGNATTQVGSPELVIYSPMDAPAKLGWKMDVSVSLGQAWWVVIDAQNGVTLTTISRIASDNVVGSGVDTLGANRSLNVWQTGSTYYMIDTSKPMFNALTGTGIIETDDAVNQTQNQILSNNILQNIYYVTSASPNSWGNPDAVSAAYNLSQTYDYYESRFGRNSYDASGGDIGAVVRINGLLNAFWHPGFKKMFFGNADNFVGSLDVIGHEVTHGVASSIGSQGVLYYKDQSGALNESFADIFGEMIEARTQGTNDWWMGSHLAGANLHRSMTNPPAYGQPASMSQFVITTSDNGGVHINSGIINRAYYLLAAGLKNPIGNQNAEQIFYRCLTMSMKPLSQFIDARLGCIAAAEALHGTNSQQALRTAEAFDAVELYAAPVSVAQPTNVNAAVAASDSAMFVREHWFYDRDDLFRLETAKGDPAGGTSLVTGVNVARPAVSGNGTNMFFVGADEDLYFIQTGGTGFTNFNWAGLVHSVALSPQGRYVAMVFNDPPGVPTNQLVIFDLVSNLTSTINLVTPVSDGEPLNNISYADALSFSPDGKLLIYDALSRLRGADGVLREAWSIFGMDMETLHQQVVIPTQDDFNIGNPSFAKTSSRFAVFDAQYTNGNTAIITLDLYEGTLGGIGVSYNGVGYPVFNGDDTKVFYADEDLGTWSGRSVYVQQVSADKLSTIGSRAMAISDAKLAVIYRRGVYPSINTPPSVMLTNPIANATFIAPANVLLAATASDLDGTISKVEFYSGDKLLFTDTAAPYGVNWNNLSAGVYTVYARAYDNQGASSTTTPLRFIVNPPAQTGVLNRAGAPGFEFTLKVPQPGLYRLEASTNLVNWVSLGSFYCNTNLSFLDSAATNLPQRFYRAVSTP